MSYPTQVGEVVAGLDLPGVDRFPFIWWASGAKFTYQAGARHLFCMCQSAAEVFFFRAFTELDGVVFTPTAAECRGVTVEPQKLAAKHRIDFAVTLGSARVAVEIDGLQFHRQSAAQVESDYLRARRLASVGWNVVRFTASESFRDPAECWKQVNAILTAHARRSA